MIFELLSAIFCVVGYSQWWRSDMNNLVTMYEKYESLFSDGTIQGRLDQVQETLGLGVRESS